MQSLSRIGEEEELMELPPGFRFHPTDEELITHYLKKKVLDSLFCAKAVGEVDLNKVEPWDLPWRAKMGEKEWYFFCIRDKKYPTGLRTNRATDAGYWKATGKDREIYKGKQLIGMKKTLVFYKGRAPKGEKSNWVMHEYRLEGKYSVYNLPDTAKNEWVICRVFQKRTDGKKVHISGLGRFGSYGNQFHQSVLPPLMDSSPYNSEPVGMSSSHVTCFSDQIHEDPTAISSHEPLKMGVSRNSIFGSLPSFSQLAAPSSSSLLNSADSVLLQDNSILKMLLLENQNSDLGMENPRIGFSAGLVDTDCFWNI